MSDFWSTLRLLPYFMCANSEGSGDTAQMRRLAWVFAGCLCDKYHNLMSWLICFMQSLKHLTLIFCHFWSRIKTNRIYDGVEASTRTSQASFKIIHHKRGSAEHETNNLKTSLRFPCRGLNTTIDYFSLTSCFSSFPQPEFFVFAQEYKNAVCKTAT